MAQTQIPPADLDIPVLGQLAPAQLTLGVVSKRVRWRPPPCGPPLEGTAASAGVSAGLRHSDGAVADPRTASSADEEGRVHSGATGRRRTERTGELGVALRV
jgi:hypothetical protein